MEKLLINTADLMWEFAPSTRSTEFASYKHALSLSQAEFIKPVIGITPLENLLTAMDDDSFSVLDRKLLDLCRAPLALLAQEKCVSYNNITATDGGFHVTKSDTHVPASEARVNAFRDQLSMDGQACMDRLLDFLTAEGLNITGYKTSDARADNMRNLINIPKDFNKYTSIQLGAFMLHNLRPVMSRVEEQVIKPALCGDLYDFIKNEIMIGNDFGVYAPLIPFIQRAIVHFTLSWASEEMNISVIGPKLMMSFRDSSATSNNGQKNLEFAPINRMMIFNKREAATAIDLLKKHLIENIDDYPLYSGSDCYTAHTSPSSLSPTSGSGIYPGL